MEVSADTLIAASWKTERRNPAKLCPGFRPPETCDNEDVVFQATKSWEDFYAAIRNGSSSTRDQISSDNLGELGKHYLEVKAIKTEFNFENHMHSKSQYKIK